MANPATYVQEGKIINYKNTSDRTIAGGEVLVLTDRIGVATFDIKPGRVGTVELSGGYEIDAETAAAFTVGQTLYWDAENSRLTGTKAASGSILAGIAIEAKAADAASALVRL